jgi:hypothetical protein
MEYMNLPQVLAPNLKEWEMNKNFGFFFFIYIHTPPWIAMTTTRLFSVASLSVFFKHSGIKSVNLGIMQLF